MLKELFKGSKLSTRPAVVAFLVAGAGLLAWALFSDHVMAGGWGSQTMLDFARGALGVLLLYVVVRVFGHVRTHELKERPDLYEWKFLAFVCTLVLSCAYIIGSALQA